MPGSDTASRAQSHDMARSLRASVQGCAYEECTVRWPQYVRWLLWILLLGRGNERGGERSVHGSTGCLTMCDACARGDSVFLLKNDAEFAFLVRLRVSVQPNKEGQQAQLVSKRQSNACRNI